MTTPDAGDVRGRIFEAACRMPVVWTGDRLTPSTIADALLPVVEELLTQARREAAAEALEAGRVRELADEFDRLGGGPNGMTVFGADVARLLRKHLLADEADLPSDDAG